MLSADHHTHLLSPAAAERISAVREVPPRTATQLVEVLDRDGVGAALALSVAYFFAMPDLEQDHAALVAENNWIAEEAGRHPDRLAACCSINPLAADAMKELERCAATGNYVGVKLHLANSDVDLRNRDHLDAVGDVFEYANGHDMIIVVHMRTRRTDYGAEDATSFINHLAARAPRSPIQIAHVAGWGGYDVANDNAFAVFADWVEAEPSTASNIYFDIAVAPLDYEAPEPDQAKTGTGEPPEPWSVRRFTELANKVRRVGMDKILFGTDWPVATPATYFADLQQRLPLDATESTRLSSNAAPWLASAT